MKSVFKVFSTWKGYYVYDRNKNSIIEISFQDYKLLKNYGDDSFYDKENILGKYQKEGFLLPHEIKQIKHPASDSLCKYVDRKTEKITLQVTQNCNLRCDYCVYSGGYSNRSHCNKDMSFSVAKKSIDYLFSHSSGLKKVDIGFYGGEPLLNFDLIKKCVSYLEVNYKEKEYSLSITTNGTLLKEDIVKYLFDKNFNIMISLDGPREMHNLHRKYINGEGSFDDILNNLERINDNYPSKKNKIAINTVISPETNFSCIINFYNSDEILENYSPRYNLLSGYGSKEAIIYKEAFNISSEVGKLKALLYLINKLPLENVPSLFRSKRGEATMLASSLSYIDFLPETCHPGGPCIAGVRRLFVDVNGNLFPCERVDEKSDATKIGHIDKGVDLEKIRKLINIGKITETECSNCWAFLHCTLCATASDNGKCLSRNLKLSRCENVLHQTLHKFKEYCFLCENGIDFDNMSGDENE